MHISHGRRRQTGAGEAGDPDGDVLVCHLQKWSRSPAGEDMLAEDALVGGPRRGLQVTLGWHPLRGEVLDLDVPQARVNVGTRLDDRIDVPKVVVRELLLCERSRLLPAAWVPPPRPPTILPELLNARHRCLPDRPSKVRWR